MEFEWDEKKRASNFAKHGVDFGRAALIFNGAIVSKEDRRKDYGERRFVSMGLADGEFLTVTYTIRGNRVRIISAWKGGRKDYEHYKNSHAGRIEGHE